MRQFRRRRAVHRPGGRCDHRGPPERTRDLGGPLGTKAFTARVVANLKGEG